VYTLVRINLSRWLAAAGLVCGTLVRLPAQVTEPDLPRPGSVVVAEAVGEVTMITSDRRKALKPDDRLQVGASIATGRRSMTSLALSNGILLRLGPESELDVEEFGQAATSESMKFAELKAEPTISRTKLRLVRGDVGATVKPLSVSRGSSFTLTTVAGILRTSEGDFRARVQMHDLGLGVCTIEVQQGSAEFQVMGSTGFVPVPAGRKLAFALEVDRTGIVKVGEMPKETSQPKMAKP
jgi:hypothetical protein